MSQLSNRPHLQAFGESNYCVLTGKFLISVYTVFLMCVDSLGAPVWVGMDEHTMAKRSLGVFPQELSTLISETGSFVRLGTL